MGGSQLEEAQMYLAQTQLDAKVSAAMVTVINERARCPEERLAELLTGVEVGALRARVAELEARLAELSQPALTQPSIQAEAVAQPLAHVEAVAQPLAQAELVAQPPSEFTEMLARLFDTLDTDGDGLLREKECRAFLLSLEHGCEASDVEEDREAMLAFTRLLDSVATTGVVRAGDEEVVSREVWLARGGARSVVRRSSRRFAELGLGVENRP